MVVNRTYFRPNYSFENNKLKDGKCSERFNSPCPIPILISTIRKDNVDSQEELFIAFLLSKWFQRTPWIIAASEDCKVEQESQQPWSDKIVITRLLKKCRWCWYRSVILKKMDSSFFKAQLVPVYTWIGNFQILFNFFVTFYNDISCYYKWKLSEIYTQAQRKSSSIPLTNHIQRAYVAWKIVAAPTNQRGCFNLF